jgi:hypothetical protein
VLIGQRLVAERSDQLLDSKRAKMRYVTKALPVRIKRDARERARASSNAVLRLRLLEQFASVFISRERSIGRSDALVITVSYRAIQRLPFAPRTFAEFALDLLVDELNANVRLIACSYHVEVPNFRAKLRALVFRDERRAVSHVGLVAKMATIGDLLHVVACCHTEMREQSENRRSLSQRNVVGRS